MDSQNTEQSEAPTIKETRYMVTYSFRENKFSPTTRHTQRVTGDLERWVDEQRKQYAIFVIDFAIMIWD